MRSTSTPLTSATPSSPTLSLESFDDDSDAPVSRIRIAQEPGHVPAPVSTVRNNSVHVASPWIPQDLATQSNIAQLRTMIQHEFSLLKDRFPAPCDVSVPETDSLVPTPAGVTSVPETAFADALRAELAVQMAKVSVLEEEVRKLRSEKQGLRIELERVKDGQPMRAQLDAANVELERLYVERKGLWEERADLWKERQSLWEERADLWKERGDLWAERGDLWTLRDRLMGQIESLTGEKVDRAAK